MCASPAPPHPSILSPQVLVGVVKDEGSYFLVYGAPGFSKDNESLISRAQFLAGVRVGVPQASDLAAEAVVLHYTDWLHPEDPARLREALSDVVGDHNVVCPVAQLAGLIGKNNTDSQKDCALPKNGICQGVCVLLGTFRCST